MIDAILHGVHSGLTGFFAAFIFICALLASLPILAIIRNIVGTILNVLHGDDDEDDDIH